MIKLMIECGVLMLVTLSMSWPTAQRPLPHELEIYFTNEEWYTELTRDEQDEWCRRLGQ